MRPLSRFEFYVPDEAHPLSVRWPRACLSSQIGGCRVAPWHRSDLAATPARGRCGALPYRALIAAEAVGRAPFFLCVSELIPARADSMRQAW